MRRLIVFLMLVMLALRTIPAQAQTVLLDPDFGTNGRVTSIVFPGFTVNHVSAILPLKDGRFIIAVSLSSGTDKDIGLIRYHSNGTVDTTFGVDGRAIIDFDFAFDDINSSNLVEDHTGRIILTGYTDRTSDDKWSIAVFTAAGFLDPGFSGDGLYEHNPPLDDDLVVRYTAVDADGIIYVLVEGTRTDTLVFPLTTLYRFLPDGSFGHLALGAIQSRIIGIGKDSQNHLLVAYSDGSGELHINTQRWLPSKDLLANDASYTGGFTTYTAGQLPGGGIQNLVVQSDGRPVVIAGGCCQLNTFRFTTAGALDMSFGNAGFGVANIILNLSRNKPYSAFVDSQDRIFVIGYADTGGSNGNDFAVVRLTDVGFADPTFDTDGLVTIDFGPGSQDYGYAGAIMPDGDLIVVGKSGTGPGMARLDLGSSPALIQNASFEIPDPKGGGMAFKWKGAKISKDKRRCGGMGHAASSCAFYFVGVKSEKSSISQTLKPAAAYKTAGTALTLSFWAKFVGSNIKGKVVMYYADGTTDAFTLQTIDAPDLEWYHFTSAPFIMPKAVTKLKVSFSLNSAVGSAWLDDVALTFNAARMRDAVLPLPVPPAAFRSIGG